MVREVGRAYLRKYLFIVYRSLRKPVKRKTSELLGDFSTFLLILMNEILAFCKGDDEL